MPPCMFLQIHLHESFPRHEGPFYYSVWQMCPTIGFTLNLLGLTSLHDNLPNLTSWNTPSTHSHNFHPPVEHFRGILDGMMRACLQSFDPEGEMDDTWGKFLRRQRFSYQLHSSRAVADLVEINSNTCSLNQCTRLRRNLFNPVSAAYF